MGLSKKDLKVIHDMIKFVRENICYEKATSQLSDNVLKEYKKCCAEEPLVTHLKKTNEAPTGYELSQAAHEMFIELKKQVDSFGYSETLNIYRNIKIDNTSAKIALLKEGNDFNCKEMSEIREMLLIADTYIMILESPSDMFKLGELS